MGDDVQPWREGCWSDRTTDVVQSIGDLDAVDGVEGRVRFFAKVVEGFQVDVVGELVGRYR